MNFKKVGSLALIFLFFPALAYASVANSYQQLYNPLPSNELACYTVACDLVELFLIILRDFLQIIPVVSVLGVVIGGAQMIVSAGNDERIARAKRTIFYSVMGLVFALLSFSIIAIVREILQVQS